MSQNTASTRSPWSWVPTGYFAEGLPYVMITWVAATMFKNLGHSDTEITFWVGNLTLVWSLKPWSLPQLRRISVWTASTSPPWIKKCRPSMSAF